MPGERTGCVGGDDRYYYMSTTIRTNNASFHPSAPGSRTKLFHCQTDGRRQKTGGSAGNAELMRNPPGDWNGGFCGKITRLAVSGGQLVETSENLDDSLMVNYVQALGREKTGAYDPAGRTGIAGDADCPVPKRVSWITGVETRSLNEPPGLRAARQLVVWSRPYRFGAVYPSWRRVISIGITKLVPVLASNYDISAVTNQLRLAP
ncbi:uncharacterized protein CIMG_07874 [Coccidioides immitis RS]|uniref:Uncharacterized protein n=1 Tax=Coccidioides immitis (strain RS) TaxID=246410 RepID=J3K4B5_COCIM|nr:uncharacterized protein CIMG_07874 [Coccidioides immitis RS]EAS29128.3 hypothetical protein CIMG_07874 [Coccidioides immitis RS]